MAYRRNVRPPFFVTQSETVPNNGPAPHTGHDPVK